MIVNLSISQLLMLLITVFGSIIVMLQNDEYTDWLRFPDHREVLCFLTLLFSVSTSVFYGLIAFNRLLSTVFEGLYNKLAPWILCAVLVVAGWLLSAFGAAFPWMTKYMVFGKDTYFLLGYPWFAAAPCNDGLTNRGIFWLVTSAYFILPALSTIVCYVVILIFIFKTQRLAGLPVNSPRAINLRDRARVLLMLSSASLMYLLCFFLPMIFWSTRYRASSANYFFMWLVYAQNALNPVFFGLINPQFREAYFRVCSWLVRRWSCKRPYNDRRERRVFPVGGVHDREGHFGPPSVTFQSAKNSIIFQNNFNPSPSAVRDAHFVASKPPPAITTHTLHPEQNGDRSRLPNSNT
ncbi:hypothetical protein RvY_09134-2 [Ramazzottius varieornatus]|uniref:G-protein coupled receptors family 1 profile domain-containing protein n=1 Tax=Ramazzottius varieornatus TaxID=947166 RepID=A0A1D1V8E5_RAMVA|nr:hypothetical protein RvY_09134-2 [Ramazzottius varieornatus]